jgi:hypothetical protein
MTGHSSGALGGFFAKAYPDGYEVERECSICGELFMEPLYVVRALEFQGRPLVCLSCDDPAVTGKRIHLLNSGFWMTGGS